jgi:hypothetical protein
VIDQDAAHCLYFRHSMRHPCRIEANRVSPAFISSYKNRGRWRMTPSANLKDYGDNVGCRRKIEAIFAGNESRLRPKAAD